MSNEDAYIGTLIDKTAEEIEAIIRGGEGSGHHGHEGRPGEVGGSLPSGEAVKLKPSLTDDDLLRFEEEYQFAWETRRKEFENRLLEQYGEGDWESGIWIGPSGKYLAPLEDHQQTAMDLLGWKGDLLTSEGMELSAEATNDVVHAGLIRYNITETDVYFDLPHLEEVTDEQWTSMAAVVNLNNEYLAKAYGEGPNTVSSVVMTLGAYLRDVRSEEMATGREAYEYLGLEDQYDYGFILRGGVGSGHHGHAGRPGEVGGSAPSGISRDLKYAARMARHYDDFEKFEHDWSLNNYTGLYFHLTNGEDFVIDPLKGPRDTSSWGSGKPTPGKFMVTTDIENWVEALGPRTHVAIIDMTELKPGVDYWDTTRGFGHEIYVENPEKVRVVDVVLTEDAIRYSRRLYDEVYPQSSAELREIWDWANENLVERGGEGSGHHGHAGRPGEVGGSLPSGRMGSVGNPRYSVEQAGSNSWGVLDHRQAKRHYATAYTTKEQAQKWADENNEKWIESTKDKTETLAYLKDDAGRSEDWKESRTASGRHAMRRRYSGAVESMSKKLKEHGEPLSLAHVPTDSRTEIIITPKGDVYIVDDHDLASSLMLDQIAEDKTFALEGEPTTAGAIFKWLNNVQGIPPDDMFQPKQILMAMGFVRGFIEKRAVEKQNYIGIEAATPVSTSAKRAIRDIYTVFPQNMIIETNARQSPIEGEGEGSEMPDREFIDTPQKIEAFLTRTFLERGGPGSGHHDHEGRPGEVGGSQPAGSTAKPKLKEGQARLKKTGETVWKKVCDRCGGSGKYSFNLMYGSMCFGCHGRGWNPNKKKPKPSEIYKGKPERKPPPERAPQTEEEGPRSSTARAAVFNQLRKEEPDRIINPAYEWIEEDQQWYPSRGYVEASNWVEKGLDKALFDPPSLDDMNYDEVKKYTWRNTLDLQERLDILYGNITGEVDWTDRNGNPIPIDAVMSLDKEITKSYESGYPNEFQQSLATFFADRGYLTEKQAAALLKKRMEIRGGPGSGHHGHKGRPGEVGGSLPDGMVGENISEHLKVPKTPLWEPVNRSLRAIESVHGINPMRSIRVFRSKATKTRGTYWTIVTPDEMLPDKLGVVLDKEAGARQTRALTFAHEVGHYLDHDLFGDRGYFATENMVDKEAEFQKTPEILDQISTNHDEARAFQKWWSAVRNSEAYFKMQTFSTGVFHRVGDTLVPGALAGARNYFYTPGMLNSWRQVSEYFARSYSQYIATRSGDAWMDNEIESELQFTRNGGAPTQWEADDFEPIGEAFDELFGSMGLLR